MAMSETTQSNPTRRMMIAGAAVPLILPALPALARTDQTDPALIAYAEWRRAERAYEPYLITQSRAPVLGDEYVRAEAEGKPFADSEWRAKVTLANVTATTPQGILRQIEFGEELFGDCLNNWAENIDRECFLSIGRGVLGLI